MSGNNSAPAVLPPAFRVLFGIVAIGLLLENAPWQKDTWLSIALGIVAPIMFGLMALGDHKETLFRNLVTGTALVYLALLAVKLLGVAV